MTQYAPENRSSPESSASYISRLTFGWLGPLIKQGYKKKLCFDDLWTLTPDREVEYQSERFNHYAHNKQSIPLWKCVLGYFRYRLLRTAVLIVLYDLLVLSNFFLLSWILTIFQTEDPDLVIGSILVIFLGLGTISSVLVEKHYYGYGSDMDIDVKSILSVKIYEKTLRLNNMTKGDVMTMMSVDTMKVAECFENFHAVWEAPCMLILVVALTASVLGWSAIIGGAVLVVAIPIYYFMCSFWYNQQDLLMTLQDKRVKSLTQALEGILTIKLFHWGEFAKNIIDKIRAKELISVRYYNILFTVCMTMILCICTIISAISLGCFVLFGNVLTPEIIFPVLYLYQAATWPLIDFPYILSALIQAYSSCKRIETFLHLAEIPHSYQVPGDQIQVEMIDCTFTYPAPVELPSDDSETSETEEASNSTDSFLKDETGTDLQSVVLSNINFKSCGSELIAIVGSVGVGKVSTMKN
jgi:ABC-type multidrug transport system fused ATPase/permease subunit